MCHWTAPGHLLAAALCDVQVGGHHEVGGQLQVGLLVPGLDQSEVTTAALRQSQLTCMKSCLVTRRGRCGLPGSESRVRSTAEMESRSCGGEEYWGRAEAEDRAENTPGMVNLVSHRTSQVLHYTTNILAVLERSGGSKDFTSSTPHYGWRLVTATSCPTHRLLLSRRAICIMPQYVPHFCR